MNKKKQSTPTHPFPGVPSPQFPNTELPQLPKESGVHWEVEAKDANALKPLKAPHPRETSGVREGKKNQDEGPDQRCPPQGDERMGEEERWELGQTNGVHRAQVHAYAKQGEEVAHFLHNVRIL